jgi:hypothetical protein
MNQIFNELKLISIATSQRQSLLIALARMVPFNGIVNTNLDKVKNLYFDAIAP